MHSRSKENLDEAIACYRRAVELKPDYVRAHSNLLYALNFCSGYDARTRLRRAPPLEPAARRAAGEVHPAPCQRPLRRSPLAGGLCFARFPHAIPWGDSCCRCWKRTTIADFEIFCYASQAVPDCDHRTLPRPADVWRNVFALSDEQLADVVRQDRSTSSWI